MCRPINQCAEVMTAFTERAADPPASSMILETSPMMDRNLIVLRGGGSTNQRGAMLQTLTAESDSEERLVLAKGCYIGEDFDDRRLDTLFLTTPVSWHGTIMQYVGRLHRTHPGRQDVRVFDHADRWVPVLVRMFAKRTAKYRSLG